MLSKKSPSLIFRQNLFIERVWWNNIPIPSWRCYMGHCAFTRKCWNRLLTSFLTIVLLFRSMGSEHFYCLLWRFCGLLIQFNTHIRRSTAATLLDHDSVFTMFSLISSIVITISTNYPQILIRNLKANFLFKRYIKVDNLNWNFS